MGLGGLGGGSQMLFGGSGGQDLFQKTTWVLSAIFVALAIILFFMRSNNRENFRYLSEQNNVPFTTEIAPEPTAPAEQQPAQYPETTEPAPAAPTESTPQ